MNIKNAYKLQHLSTLSIENILTSLGLYSPFLITLTSTIEDHGFYVSKGKLVIADDLKRLFELTNFSKPHMIPCCKCGEKQPFSKCDGSLMNGENDKLILYINKNTFVGFDKSFPESDCNLALEQYNCNMKNRATNLGKKNTYISLKETIISQFSSFSIGLSCSMETTHTAEFFFTIETIENDIKDVERESGCRTKQLFSSSDLTDEEKKAIKNVDFCNNTLIITKIGQYPSIADLQFNDLQKYKKILKKNYKELSKAVGLHANGIGIGAFVYLRRIFEYLCEETHKECVKLPGWDEEKYSKGRVNDHVKDMERFGKIIIPNELEPIRNKLYGVISKGIHKYGEEECLELFPDLLTIIELLLDRRIEANNRAEKITESIKRISSISK